MLKVYSNPSQPHEDDSADERENFLYGIDFVDQKTDKKNGGDKGQSKKAKVQPKKVTPSGKKKKENAMNSSKDSIPSVGFGGDIAFNDPEKVWI